MADKETHAAIWEDVKKAFGVNSLQELKSMPAAELYPVWSKASAKHSGFGACPSIDGEYILTTTEESVNSGRMKNVPLLLGMLSEDMYPILLYKGIMEIADARRKQNGAPVYSYFFDYKVHRKWGAYHAVDIAYAFGLRTELARKVKEEDIRIQQDLFTGFCNFIRCGNPNGRNQCTSGENTASENIACTDSGISNPKGFSQTSCPGSDQSEALSSPWLSMQESDGGFYELNGINHGMYHPDVDTLIKQTEEGQPFPTA